MRLILTLFFVLAVFLLPAQEVELAWDCDAPLPSEKIVLHTDRGLYLVGEKIWFKAYCLLEDQPSSQLSKVLYVELFNSENKVLIQGKFQIVGGLATGALEIPEEVQSGIHFLRAYTLYLRNFPPEHFSHRLLAIVNPESDPPVLARPKQDSLAFVLADKELVAGLPTRMLVCFDPDICNQKEQIALQNEQGEILAGCSALYPGRALFKFTPQAGIAYQAVLTMDNGRRLLKNLPPVRNSGLSCQAEALENRLRVALRRHPDEAPSRITVRVLSEDFRLMDSRVIDLHGTDHQFIFSMDNLNSGIYYVVAGSQEDEFFRIYPFFHSGPPPVPLSLKANRASFDIREKVALTIEAPEGQRSYVSVAVRKTGLGEESLAPFPDFVWDNPWLLPSYLPEWNHWEKAQLEVALMLLADQLNTKGRHFLPEKKNLQWIPEIRGLTLSGLMRNKESGAAAGGEIVLAAVAGNQPQIQVAETKADGSFLFTLHNLEGKHTLFVGWKGAGGAPPEILVNNNFSNRFPKITPSPLTFEAGQHELFEELYVNAQLSAAFEPARQESAFAAAPPLFRITNIGKPDYAVEINDFINIPTLEEVFREIVPYVLVRRKEGKPYLEVFNEHARQAYDGPLVLLDNIPVFDIGRLLEINPGSIEKIEVINSNYLFGDYLFGGLVSLRTNTGDFANYQWAGQSAFASFDAISPGAAFQHLVYPSAEARSSPEPDFRPLLYWNPAVETGDGAVNLEFYTSGLAGTYEVVARGVAQGGRPCFGRALIEVREGQ